MRNLLILIVLVFLTFPAWKALRHPGMISGHDTESAVFKSEEFFNALKDGNFPPRWAKRLDYGLGQPTFTFTYTLPYYLTSGLMFLGLNAIWAVKILMAISFPIAAFFAYLWLSGRFGFWPGLAGGLIYAYLPYRFANVYVRGAIGEIVASAILPLTFWALDRLAEKSSAKKAATAALIIAGLILAHQFYGLIMLPIWLAYVWIISKTKNNRLWGWGCIIWGYVICSFYIIPAVIYRNLTFLDELGKYFLEKQVFVDLSRLIYSPWGFAGVHETDAGPMSVQLGAVAIILFVGFLAVIGKKNVNLVNRRLGWLFLGLILTAIFMMQQISLPIWKLLPFLMSMQFPWRLLFLANISMIFTIGYFLNYLFVNTKLKNFQGIFTFLILGLLVVWSVDYWKVYRYYYSSELPDISQTIGYPGTLTLLWEETPKWHNVRQEANPHNFFQYATGSGEITFITWKTNYHQFEVDAKTESIVNDKTHFWPGWKVWLNGKEVELLDPYDQLSQGLITFAVDPGKNLVEARLTEPLVNKLANGISLISLGIAGIITVRKKHEEARH